MTFALGREHKSQASNVGVAAMWADMCVVSKHSFREQILLQVLGYSLAKPAREVLFTVVPREEMYKAKICIDTLVVRAGDMFAAALFHFLDGQYHLGMTPIRPLLL